MLIEEWHIILFMIFVFCVSFWFAKNIAIRKMGLILFFLSAVAITLTLSLIPKGTTHIGEFVIAAIVVIPYVVGGLMGGLVGWIQSEKPWIARFKSKKSDDPVA